jgi:dCMP deaminase
LPSGHGVMITHPTHLIQTCDRWDARFFSMCDLLASWSEDPHRGVGCVIVGPASEVRATGYNGLPRGAKISATRLDRDESEKFSWIEHAERNALFNAARVGVSVAGCTLYSNCFPCVQCARAIIQSGLSGVRTLPFAADDPLFDREDPTTFILLRETGVALSLYDWPPSQNLRVS